ncbi:MAG: S8 family serine peptidase, partial [Coriobacteriia bacterium]|nr:S8 family serine peptidase [Coriobacteriia bacterium]
MKNPLTIKKIAGILLCAIMLAATLGSIIAHANPEAELEESTTSHIVFTRDDVSYDRITSDIDDQNIYSFESDVLSDNNIFVADLTKQEVRALDRDTNVLFIEEDIELSASAAESSEGSNSGESNWNLQAINVTLTEDAVEPEQRVSVAVLDSGVDFVRGIDLSGAINLVPEEQDISPLFWDLTGHGTAIASIIAGNGENVVQGINPNVDLYSVKVLNESNVAPLSRIIEGIYWCIENDINIINMSFGAPVYSQIFHSVVEDAHSAGILMVASAGNGTGTVEFPAAFNEVMGVASTNTHSQISDFSNTGSEVDIAAPGEKIRVISFFGGNTIEHGTSISTPHVTGVAALLWERDLSKSSDFIRELISHSARSIEQSEDFGLLDASFALEVYDDFASTFDSTASSSLPTNTEVPETFKHIDDDESYVEGRWSQANHQVVVDKANTGSLTTVEVNILKRGAIYPDRPVTEVPVGSNFLLHGYYYIYRAETGQDSPVNYIEVYNLLASIAIELGKTDNTGSFAGDMSSIKAADFLGITFRNENTEIFNRIKGIFVSDVKGSTASTQIGNMGSGTNWTHADVLGSGNDTPRNRKIFTYGIAMHGATDAFAHSSLVSQGGSYIIIMHNSDPPGNADSITVVPERFRCAERAAQLIIDELLSASTTPRGYHIFAEALSANSGTFRLPNILAHADAVGMPNNYSGRLNISKINHNTTGFPVFTIEYEDGYSGATGTMSNTQVVRGIEARIRTNEFTRPDHTFTGWHARNSSNQWRYHNDATGKVEWLSSNQIPPSGYERTLYLDRGYVWDAVPANQTVVFVAQWKQNAPKQNTFTVKYHANGGTGTMANTTINYGTKTPIRANTFTRSGY